MSRHTTYTRFAHNLAAARHSAIVLLLSGLCLAMSGGCANSQSVAAADGPVYQQCEREARMIAGVPIERSEELFDDRTDSAADEAIDDARAARDEADLAGPAAWPEDALVIRCLAANSIALTPEQAKVLAKWERSDGEEGGEQ